MPEKQEKPEFHEHPRNMHDKVYGVKLGEGDVLDAKTDVYASTNGFWEVCPCPGVTLGEGADRLWIRRMPDPADTIRIQLPPRDPLPPV